MFRIPTSNHSSYREWLIDLFNQFDTRNRNLLAITICAVWFAKNRVIHKGLKQRSQDVTGFILRYIQEIEGLSKENTGDWILNLTIWRPPHQELIKINFDSSFNMHTMQSCSGISLLYHAQLTSAFSELHQT